MTTKYSLWQKYLISREISRSKFIPLAKIQNQIVKTPSPNYLKRLHPKTKALFNKMTQSPKPLTYKLKELAPEAVITPLGVNHDVPFFVRRTFTSNLPVYTSYSNRHIIKKTLIRNVSGNLEEFKKELEKITSNSEVKIKTGKVEINGLHTEKVKHYLMRLGF